MAHVQTRPHIYSAHRLNYEANKSSCSDLPPRRSLHTGGGILTLPKPPPLAPLPSPPLATVGGCRREKPSPVDGGGGALVLVAGAFLRLGGAAGARGGIADLFRYEDVEKRRRVTSAAAGGARQRCGCLDVGYHGPATPLPPTSVLLLPPTPPGRVGEHGAAALLCPAAGRCGAGGWSLDGAVFPTRRAPCWWLACCSCASRFLPPSTSKFLDFPRCIGGVLQRPSSPSLVCPCLGESRGSFVHGS